MNNMENEKSSIVNEFLPQLKTFMQNESVFGKPYTIGETMVIPVNTMKVGFAFGEGASKNRAAAGGGLTMTPVGFLIVHEGTVKMQSLAGNGTTLETILEKVPEFLEKTYDLAMKVKRDTKKEPENS